jgi:hypothetical protein
LVETSYNAGDLAAQAFVGDAGHKLLLVNKMNQTIQVTLEDAAKATALTVDPETGDSPARTVKPIDGKIALEPFAVTVVSW